MMYLVKRRRFWCLQTYPIVSRFLEKVRKRIEYSLNEIRLTVAGNTPEQVPGEGMLEIMKEVKTISLLSMSNHQILGKIQTQFLAI
jgi:hypothetical protein